MLIGVHAYFSRYPLRAAARASPARTERSVFLFDEEKWRPAAPFSLRPYVQQAKERRAARAQGRREFFLASETIRREPGFDNVRAARHARHYRALEWMR
jgi:hypothetical protein